MWNRAAGIGAISRRHIDRKIQFGQRVLQASWSSAQAQWTVQTHDVASGQTRSFTSSFIISCTGYYDYDHGYTPEFKGRERFGGTIVHPQHWPEDLDYTGKRIVVIGSGATAVTLVPTLAKKAAHVTMLQRSPTYGRGVAVRLWKEERATKARRPDHDQVPGWVVSRRRSLRARRARCYGSARLRCRRG